MKGNLFVLLIFTSWFKIYSQYEIQGEIRDAHTGKPLVGAQIMVHETFIGTYSDYSGKFVIKLKKDPPIKLIVSYLGYFNDTVIIKKLPENNIIVDLQPRSYLTQEVVIQGIRLGGREIPTFTMLNQQQIEQKNFGTDIPTVLNLLPSVTVNTDAGTGIGYTNIWIRGTDQARINVTLNGVPYNDPESHGVFWVDIPDLLSSARDLQVQRGVGTSTNGTASFGASININTMDFNPDSYATLLLRAGSYKTYGSTLRFGTGLLNQHWVIDGRASYLHSDGYIDRAFAQLQSFQINSGWFGARDILRFMVLRGQEKTYQAWYGVPKDSLKTNRTYNPYTYKNEIDFYQQGHYHLVYSHQFSEFFSSSVTAFLTTGFGYYEQYKENQELTEYRLPLIVIENDTITQTDLIRRKFLDNDFYGFVYSLDYNSHQKWTLNVGGTISRYDGRHFGRLIWMKYAGPIKVDHEYYRAYGLKDDGSFYAKFSMNPNKNLSTFIDVQIRGIQHKIWGLDDEVGNLNLKKTYVFLNPKTGISYNLNQWKFFIYWGMASREPTRYMLVEADSGQIPVPEHLYDLEMVIQKKGNTYTFQLNPFYMLYRNQFVQTGEINSVGVPVYVNVPHSYRTGIEFLGQWKPLSKLTWDFNLTYSLNKMKNVTIYIDNWDTWSQDSAFFESTDISFSPPYIFNSQLTYELTKFLTLGLETKHVARQYIDLTSSKERSLDPYTVFNFNIGFHFSPQWSKGIDISVSLRNIFSEKYETNAWVYRYISGGAEQVMDGYFPQAPLHVFGLLQVKF
ncbi:MAG: TonB-dependent receptor [Bacteroidales bacterium]|nr:TonB-dependent receptor [Bacteroidales bacterium]